MRLSDLASLKENASVRRQPIGDVLRCFLEGRSEINPDTAHEFKKTSHKAAKIDTVRQKYVR